MAGHRERLEQLAEDVALLGRDLQRARVGLRRLVVAPEQEKRAPEHHPALGVLRRLSQAYREPLDHRLELLRRDLLRRLRVERARLAELPVRDAGKGRDKQAEDQRRNSGAYSRKSFPGSGTGVLCNDAVLDLAARTDKFLLADSAALALG